MYSGRKGVFAHLEGSMSLIKQSGKGMECTFASLITFSKCATTITSFMQLKIDLV